MNVRQRPVEATTPDGIVLSHVRKSQYLTMGFAVLLPVIGLVTGSPGLTDAVYLAGLLLAFVVLRAFTIGLTGELPPDPWRAVLVWSLALVGVSAATLAAAGTTEPWLWLVLPGTATADVIALRENRNASVYAALIAVTMATCVYLVMWPELGGSSAWQQSLLAFFVVMFIGYWESTGPLLWRRTVDAEETTLRLALTEERLRISEDLHDILGRALEVVAFKGELASRLIRTAPDRAEHELEEMQVVARGAVQDVRELVRARQTTHVADEVQSAERLLRSASIRSSVRGSFAEVPDELANPLGRVVREGITNMLRHANATTCEIHLTRDPDGFELVVRNDGVSRRAGATPHRGSRSGIDSLHRHIAEFGGELTSEEEGATFTLTARLPPAAGAGPREG
ncbi:sensor histidine kinase [Nocardiopsis sp. NPDC058631]|uniref:sensor histidine kinase n=1 Tax=Nocardiopsis sp. NPDC058631 TaxID=3346566 RepID=UPI00365F1103